MRCRSTLGRARCTRLLGENGAGQVDPHRHARRCSNRTRAHHQSLLERCTLASPAAATAASASYQHSALIPSMTVIENLMLARGGLARSRGRDQHLSELGATLGGRIDPNDRVGTLSLGSSNRARDRTK